MSGDTGVDLDKNQRICLRDQIIHTKMSDKAGVIGLELDILQLLSDRNWNKLTPGKTNILHITANNW